MSESDNYDTLEKIGHGSFGIIRKVRRKTDGFVMCRKEISYLRMSQKEREQLHAEFQILSHLRHPNIVAYYHREHLKQSQDLHLYMEYCGNGDLGRVIKDLSNDGSHAQESFVWSIFSQLVSALYRCHYGVDPPDVGADVLGLAKGGVTHKAPSGAVTILHRDLKPENVFLGEDNSVKLGDFGLSKMIKSHDFASTYVGTPFYMSPEICNAEKYTLKSDIWSLGCIIYELCALEPPFNAKTHYQLVQKIKDGKVATLPEIYSPELNQVIRDCLRVNPDTRPDTANLLNLPVVRLMRKEKEVVDLNRSLRTREDAVARREKDVAEKMAALESSRAAMRQELDASLRREWEVKARLEIDRLFQSELENLKAQYETEVQARVDKLLAQQMVQQAQQKAAAAAAALAHQSRQSSRSSADFDSSKSSSCNTASSASASADDFQLGSDGTEITVDSPAPSVGTTAPSAPATLAGKRSSALLSARTPYHRAQTMFVGTPMDVEMPSPSPVAIQNLSLSPRRNGTSKPPGSAGNIFASGGGNATTRASSSARNSNDDSNWAGRDSDDDEAMMPSPSVRNHQRIKNPFTSKNKPMLQSQTKSAPLSKIRAALSSASSKSAAAAAAAAAAAQTESSSDRRSAGATRHISPDRPDRADRRLSKIPSVASLHNIHLHHAGADATPTLTVTTSIPRRGSMDRKPSNNDLASAAQQPTSAIAPSSSSSGWTSKVSSSKAKGIRGRTLVELQQARAYGRPLSAVMPAPSGLACLGGGSSSSSSGETPSPKRGGGGGSNNGSTNNGSANGGLAAPARNSHDRRASSGCLTIDTSVVAVWDPELEEDMPSPFLKRHVNMI